MGVQTLLAQAAIEALYPGVVGGLAGAAEVQLDLALIGPTVHDLGDELAAVVRLDCLGQAALGADPIQTVDHVLSLQALSDVDGQAFTRVAVHHRQHANARAGILLAIHPGDRHEVPD